MLRLNPWPSSGPGRNPMTVNLMGQDLVSALLIAVSLEPGHSVCVD